MLTIENLPIDATERKHTILAVADIEAEVQPQDAWNYQTLVQLLGQESIHLLIIYGSNQGTITVVNKVIGYCLYQVVFEQAEILRIGTHPDHQRQGMALQLLARLQTELKSRQVESLLLEVRADNTPAIALYEKQDFVVIHQRKGYYKSAGQSAIDALIMQRVYT